MKWYSKYLPVYEKPFAEVPAETVAEVRAKLAERQSDRPLATVSVIACNEEKRLTACLWSLAEQRCRYPMEIIATDNLSKDRTAEIFETLGLPWQRETTPGCGHARLCGLNRARGKSHINIDADTEGVFTVSCAGGNMTRCRLPLTNKYIVLMVRAMYQMAFFFRLFLHLIKFTVHHCTHCNVCLIIHFIKAFLDELLKH